MQIFKRSKPKLKMYGVTTILFSEKERRVYLEGERLAPGNGPSIYFWFRPNHRWSKPEGVLVTPEEKLHIKRFIEAEMKYFGTEVDVELG